MSEPPLFWVHSPQGPELPVLATIPHTGTYVPLDAQAHFAPEFLKALPNTDWHLNKLFAFLPALGVTVLEATHSRYFIDLNRDPNGALLGDFWSALIAQKGARAETIHSTILDEATLRPRIEQYHAPYHAELKRLLEGKIEVFGKAYLLDLHSFGMPIGANICLGNGEGSTCSLEWLESAERAFLEQGFSVARNQPFKGGYTVRHYGRGAVEALLLELSYGVYLEQDALEYNISFMEMTVKSEEAQNQLEDTFKNLLKTL